MTPPPQTRVEIRLGKPGLRPHPRRFHAKGPGEPRRSLPMDSPTPTRRSFLAAAGAASLSTLARGQGAPDGPAVRLGLIGCGGRGSWLMDLARQAGGFEIVAGADYFADRVNAFGAKFNVPENKRFTGLQGYKRMIEAGGLDAVAIESPPFFHPQQALDAVTAGLHVYMAKPVAVDVPGCQMVAEAGRRATAAKKVMLVDFQTRATEVFQKAIAKVHEGSLGDLCYGEAVYESGRLGPQAGGEGDAEKRLRNWVFDKTLSGDIITEQNIHTLDVMNWMLQKPPLKATGTGGRKGRTDIGDCWDHFSVLFEYPGQVGINFHSRQYGGWGAGDGITNRVFGSKGMIFTEYGGKVYLRGEGDLTANVGATPGIYRDGAFANLQAFRAAIAAGEISNPTVAPSVQSNLITLLGRKAAYTGQSVTWDDLLKDKTPLDGKLDGLKA